MYSFIISISQIKLNKHIIYCFTSIRRNPIFTDFDVDTDQLKPQYDTSVPKYKKQERGYGAKTECL